MDYQHTYNISIQCQEGFRAKNNFKNWHNSSNISLQLQIQEWQLCKVKRLKVH